MSVNNSVISGRRSISRSASPGERGVDHAVAQFAQRFDRQVAHAGIVLDHQDQLFAPPQWRPGALVDGHGRRPFAGEARQVDLDRGAAPDLRIDLHVPVRLLDEAQDLAQAEARALARRLGRKEGIEGLAHHLGRHADAGIGHRDHRVLAGSHLRVGAGVALVEIGVGRLDGELAAARHGVAGVDDKVDQRALDLGGVGEHAPQAAAQHGLDLDRLADRAPQHLGHAADQCVEIEHARFERLAPREGEQARGQRPLRAWRLRRRCR